MGNCGCNYVLNNTDIYVSPGSESHTTISEPYSIPLGSQKLNISSSMDNTCNSNYKFISSNSSAAASFKRQGPIIVKLQIKRSQKKLL